MSVSTKTTLKRNVVLNVIVGSWLILLSLIIAPIQIKVLGAETYGLISFMSTLQVLLLIFDLGLTTTIVRDVAADLSEAHQNSRELVQTAFTLYSIIGIVLALLLILNAHWIAQNWLNIETLPINYSAGALRIMSITLLSNWMLGLFVSALSGLQRLDVVNGLRAVTRTVIQVGGIVILVIWRDLYIFLAWMALSSLVSLGLHIWYCRRLFQNFDLTPYISLSAIRRVWRFSLNMNLTSIASVVYTQADSLMVSKLLPLSFLGYYNLAFSLTLGVANIQQFISSAVLPALAVDYSRGEENTLVIRYTKYVQVLMVVVVLPVSIFIFFGQDFLTLWADKETSLAAYAPLAVLAVGFLLNSFVVTCYTIAIATDRTRILAVMNSAAVAIYLPVLYLLVVHYQLPGAAFAWVAINIYSFITLVLYFKKYHRAIFTMQWLYRNVFVFTALGVVFVFGRMLLAYKAFPSTWETWLVFGICVVLYLAGGFLLLDRTLRQMALNFIKIFAVR